MKKLLLITFSTLMIALGAAAQRYAVIDSKYILEKLPEYKEAQTRLNQFSVLWQQDI